MLKHSGLWSEASAIMSAANPSAWPSTMSLAMNEVVSQLHKMRVFIKDEQKRFKAQRECRAEERVFFVRPKEDLGHRVSSLPVTAGSRCGGSCI